MRFEIIFVVLTYKTSKDLIDFFHSVSIQDVKSKAIIVDAYYSNEDSLEIKRVAEEFNADYISIQNRGYSYGNNKGIEYALEKYEFDFIAVCNPDIEVKKLELEKLEKIRAIYGPSIYTLLGNKQNPFRVSYSRIGEFLNYIGYKKRMWKLIRIYSAYNKVCKYIFFALIGFGKKSKYRVYSLHGSFVLFTKDIIEEYFPLYNEKMFLFGEEDYLAHKMKKLGVPMYYTKLVEILHKEDGTVGSAKINVLEVSRDSYLEYFKSKSANKPW